MCILQEVPALLPIFTHPRGPGLFENDDDDNNENLNSLAYTMEDGQTLPRT